MRYVAAHSTQALMSMLHHLLHITPMSYTPACKRWRPAAAICGLPAHQTVLLAAYAYAHACLHLACKQQHYSRVRQAAGCALQSFAAAGTAAAAGSNKIFQHHQLQAAVCPQSLPHIFLKAVAQRAL
jgi:hypothetical protein